MISFVERMRWRRVIALDLGFYNAAIFALALVPVDTLLVPELLVMAGTAFCLIGVIARAATSWHVPFEEWSYLATGFIGLISLIAYLALGPTDRDLVYSVAVPIFMLAGVSSAYAAHVIDGGPSDDGAR